ncbi:class I SAM-dependent methyltransferase [Mycobacterium talmoniae]|uniref:Methyltransferase type 12 n=1 Tax=Mycobacterium talmoniae TaxID=1858794 RepID=A0A1S1NPQ7_9MYCO|nr:MULTISPECIES: class I SAM-dependent methyltransferase [Mycobacterium]OHV06449.1 methyltransferase type 12 [Mycobacterium talmoniae]PQM49026.1 Ubiquinone biosynthesis O-methyltransferase [Mycobacterium talmoniae]TDH57399.1 class I SAM-dependent methyltransferase [Mycobacterium eburneum]
MGAKHLLFKAMYRLGFTPWDGHPLARGLRDLIEGNGSPPLPPGTAVDLGCGTGDNTVYLAQQGWQVTGVDFVPKALDQARVKAAANGVAVTFANVDVTRLSSAGVGSGFTLVVDSGCLHGMNDADRDAYVREVTAVTAPDARLLIIAFIPGGSLGVRGIDQAEIERRFTPDWQLVSAGAEPDYRPSNGDHPMHHYVLARRS